MSSGNKDPMDCADSQWGISSTSPLVIIDVMMAEHRAWRAAARVCGYWREREGDTDDQPWPVRTETNEVATAAAAPLQVLVAAAAVSPFMLQQHFHYRADAGALQRVYITQYMGQSECRLCGALVGSRELCMLDASGEPVVFPEGLYHYASEHGLRYSN
jgi:hypothetical protein